MGLGKFVAIGRSAASTMDLTENRVHTTGSLKKLQSRELNEDEKAVAHDESGELLNKKSSYSAAGSRRWEAVQKQVAVQPSLWSSCGDAVLRFLQADPELEKHEDDPEEVGGPF